MAKSKTNSVKINDWTLNGILLDCFGNRVEFEASIDLNAAENEGEMPSIIDEDEWTDRNFGDSLLLAQGKHSLKSISFTYNT